MSASSRLPGAPGVAAERNRAVAAACFAAAGVALAALALSAAVHGVGMPRLLVLLLLAPLAEEALFRAGLQDLLLRHLATPAVANGLTALAFGATHVLVRGDAAAFGVALPALLIGALYQRRRRLRHCIALHAAMNALWLAWALSR